MKLKEIRKQLGYTQDYVAAELQITRAAYCNLENGRRDPDTETLIKLAALFGCSTDELLGLPARIPRRSDSDTDDLLTAYSALTEAGKHLLLDYAKMLYRNPDFSAQAEKAAQ